MCKKKKKIKNPSNVLHDTVYFVIIYITRILLCIYIYIHTQQLFIIYAVRVVGVSGSRARYRYVYGMYIYEHVARGTLHRYAFNSRGLSAIFVVVRPPQPLVLPLSDPCGTRVLRRYPSLLLL